MFLFCFVFLTSLHSKWSVSSQTRDRTCTFLQWKHGARIKPTSPASASGFFTCWAIREALEIVCVCVCVCVCVLVAQSCLTLCDPMDGSLLGSSVYGILQAKILGWVVIPFSRGSSVPKHRTRVSYIAGRFFTIWATVFKLACGVCLSTGLVKMRYIWMWKFCVKCKTSIEFFFSLIFILYWSTVDLQCCVSFRHTAKWLSFTYIYMYSLSDSFLI